MAFKDTQEYQHSTGKQAAKGIVERIRDSRENKRERESNIESCLSWKGDIWNVSHV